MSKQYRCVTVLLVVSLILALIYTLLYLTQAVNIQVVFFHVYIGV